MKETNSNALKRLGISLILGLLLTFVVPMLTQQSVFSTEAKAESARQSTKKIMKAIRKCDDKTLNKYITDKYAYGKDNYKTIKGISPSLQTYIAKNNAKISYTIKSCKVKGNNATVKLKIKSVKSDAFVKDATERFEKYSKEIEKELDDLENKDLKGQDPMEVFALCMKKIFEAMDRAYKEAAAVQRTPVYKNDTITIKLKKSGNKWVMNKLDNRFANIMIANLGDIDSITNQK